ncbi:MAG: cytochrome C biogenesis protein CcmE [Sulfobacillus benefaciens]|uniref:Cytochrome C biogenesis protein CcmE n=1 Tax=Sulfobacillus benefaciens TaxID=453960 RepID=A0A2T2XHP1_9FIRM|nr:MAG: cytochrome C biogenesis protein CcmE [Sulfobacillus benefaciens]
MTKKVRLQIGTLVILAALVYIVLQGSHFSNYFLPVSQFRSQMSRYSNQIVKVQGTLLSSSVKYNPANRTLRFDLESQGQVLPILYQGPMPDEQFKNASAIVKGKMVNGVFDAQKLMIQCPDHYSAAPTTKS